MNTETEFNIGDTIQRTDKDTGVVIQMKVEKITVSVSAHSYRPHVQYHGGHYYSDKDLYQFVFSNFDRHTITKVEDKQCPDCGEKL